MNHKRLNKFKVAKYSLLLSAVWMLTALLLSACASDSLQGYAPAAGMTGKEKQLVLTLEDYDGSVEPENLKAALKVRQCESEDEALSKLLSSEAKLPFAKQGKSRVIKAIAKTAEKAQEEETEDAELEETLQDDPECISDEENSEEHNGACSDGCLHENEASEPESEDASIYSESLDFDGEMCDTAEEDEGIAAAEADEAAVEDLSNGFFRGSVWNTESDIENNALKLSFDIEAELFPLELTQLNIYDASVSETEPIAVLPLQSAALNSRTVPVFNWKQLNAKARAGDCREDNIAAKTAEYYNSRVNYTIQILSVPTTDFSVLVCFDDSSDIQDFSCRTETYLNSEFAYITFSAKRSVEINGVYFYSDYEDRYYGQTISLNSAAKTGYISYSNMAITSAAPYTVVVTDVAVEPCVHELQYYNADSQPVKITSGTYDKYNQTYTFTIDDNYVKLHYINIHNLTRTWGLYQISRGTFSVSYNQFLNVNWKQGRAYTVAITDKTPILPVDISKVVFNSKLSYTVGGKTVTCRPTVCQTDDGMYYLRFVTNATDAIQARINGVRIGNRTYNKAFTITFGQKAKFNGYTQGSYKVLDLSSSNFKKCTVKYTFTVKNVPSKLKNVLKYTTHKGKVYKLDNQGVYDSSNKKMTFTIKNSTDFLNITYLSIGNRKSTLKLLPTLGLESSQSYALKETYAGGLFYRILFSYKTNMGTKGNKYTNIGCPNCYSPGSGSKLTNNLNYGDGQCKYCKGKGKTNNKTCNFCNGRATCSSCLGGGFFVAPIGLN